MTDVEDSVIKDVADAVIFTGAVGPGYKFAGRRVSGGTVQAQTSTGGHEFSRRQKRDPRRKLRICNKFKGSLFLGVFGRSKAA